MQVASQQFAERADAPMSDAQIWTRFLTPICVRETLAEREFLETARCGFRSFRGHRVATYAWGDGPATVFLLHGWGGRAAQLRDYVPGLVQRGYQVLAIDAPAHGRSEGERASLFLFADALEEIGREVGGFDAIIAHSMGAASATMAMGRGLRVERAVLLAPICRLWDVLGRFVARVGLSLAQRDRLIARLEEDYGADMWDKSSLVWVGRQLDIPALIFHDRGDAEIPYQDGVDTAAAWRGAELRTTDGLGHRLILRDPAVTEQVLRFVCGQGSEATSCPSIPAARSALEIIER